VAVTERQKADVATGQAIVARDEAQVQRQEAVTQKQIADNERVKAEESEKNTQRLRLLSVARTMAIQAIQFSGTLKDDLPALLALQAYQFNLENQGRVNDPDIFAALSAILNDQTILRGHEDGVRAIALSRDGKMLVSCGDDGNIFQWQTGNPEAKPVLLKLPKSNHESFRSVMITPDQKYIVAGTFSGKLFIWDYANSQAMPGVVQAHSAAVNDLSCNPLKKQFASCGSDGKIFLWNYENDKFTKNLIDSAKTKVNAIAVDPTGKFLVSGSSDGKLKLFDLQIKSGNTQNIYSSADPVLSVALSKDGILLAAGFSSGSVRIWNTADFSGSLIEMIGQHSSGVTALTFSGNRNYLASSGFDRTMKISNVQSLEGKPVSIEKHDLWVYDITFSPDDKYLISSSADKTIRIFLTECSGMASKLSKTIKRNMTPEEWNKYIGSDIPYEKTRPDLP